MLTRLAARPLARAQRAPTQFLHVLLSLELYLLSPFMRRYIRQASLAVHGTLTVLMLGASVALLLPLSRIITGLFLAAVALVSFVCPYCLVRIHKFKAKINGPWDEAVPAIPTSLASQFRGRLACAADGLQLGASGPAASPLPQR